MSITWSGRMRLLVIPFAAAVLTVGCGEGTVLQSPTGPSSTLGSGASLTADDADSVVATAASTDEFGTLAKGGNGKGKGNGGDSDDSDDNANRGPGNGNKPDGPGGPGRSHEDRVVGFVSATTFNSVTVNGITITAGPDAVIRHGNRSLTMGDIGVGDHLQARGTMTGTSLVAIEIKVQNTNGEDDDNVGDAATLKGAISGLSATAGCPTTPVTFMIGTTKVTTSATTVFDDVACTALANGALIEVTGTVAADGIAATKVELQSGPNEVKGTVFELSGTPSCSTATPALTFKVGATLATATTVKTNGTTTFTGGTPVLTCATLANGANVEVEGTTQADGSITAASVELH